MLRNIDLLRGLPASMLAALLFDSDMCDSLSFCGDKYREDENGDAVCDKNGCHDCVECFTKWLESEQDGQLPRLVGRRIAQRALEKGGLVK